MRCRCRERGPGGGATNDFLHVRRAQLRARQGSVGVWCAESDVPLFQLAVRPAAGGAPRNGSASLPRSFGSVRFPSHPGEGGLAPWARSPSPARPRHAAGWLAVQPSIPFHRLEALFAQNFGKIPRGAVPAPDFFVAAASSRARPESGITDGHLLPRPRARRADGDRQRCAHARRADSCARWTGLVVVGEEFRRVSLTGALNLCRVGVATTRCSMPRSGFTGKFKISSARRLFFYFFSK